MSGRHGIVLFGTVILPLVLAGCAVLPGAPTAPGSPVSSIMRPGSERDFDALLVRQDRVYRLIAPLIAKNAVLCKSSARPLLGFTAKNKYAYPGELRSAAETKLRLGDALQVMQVLDGSGAMRAGIQRGDVLQSIQGQPAPQGPQAEAEAAQLLAPLIRMATEIDIGVLRDGTPRMLKVPLTTACAFTIDIGNAPQVNAYADGRRIMVTNGMLEALSDQDLAVILAREMAHNVQQHARKMRNAATLSGMIDALLLPQPDLTAFAGSGGLRPMEARLDQEADRLAQYMLARTGQDPARAIATLEQIAHRYPATVSNGYTALHPWTEERAALMRATAEEIRQKQAARKALVP